MFCTSGLQILSGAKTIDLEWVQVHPTGLVKPDDADAKIKFLAAEALRGVGGLILNKDGKRFANELGRRDYVTGEMWKNKAPFRLVLNKAASDEIHWHCKHYTGRGVMKFYESGEAFAKDINVPGLGPSPGWGPPTARRPPPTARRPPPTKSRLLVQFRTFRVQKFFFCRNF